MNKILDLINTFKLSKGLLLNNPELVEKIEKLLKASYDEDEDYAGGDSDQMDYFGDTSGYGDSDYYGDDEAPETDNYSEGFQTIDPEDEDFGTDDIEEKYGPGAKAAESEEVPAESVVTPAAKKPGSSSYREWQPKDKYEPHHQERMDKYLSQGYSHREAEAMAGAHDDMDLDSAFSSKVVPSEPSDKFLGELKGLVGPWLQGAANTKAIRAKQEENPELHGRGRVIEAKKQSEPFKSAHQEFLKSPELENLSRKERNTAIKNWKEQWHEDNPGHREKSLRAIAEAGGAFKEAREARKRNLQGMLNDVHDSLKVNPDVDIMGAQEAAQHVGGSKEEKGYTANVTKNPIAAFAEANPEFLESGARTVGGHEEKHKQNVNSKLDPKALSRMKSIDSAKNKPNNQGE